MGIRMGSSDETVLRKRRNRPETNLGYQLHGWSRRCVNMIEAVTAILGLFCAAIFLAHAVDAYRALSAQEFGAPRR
jgi:hypothetical protein